MARANKSSRSTKGAKTAKHTKKNLGKLNNRTRRHRKGAKKGKNMKKGGFLNYNTPLTTFDYASRVSDEKEIKEFVDEAYKLNFDKGKKEVFQGVALDNELKINPFQSNVDDNNRNQYIKQFNEIMKKIDQIDINTHISVIFERMPANSKKMGCIISTATGKKYRNDCN